MPYIHNEIDSELELGKNRRQFNKEKKTSSRSQGLTILCLHLNENSLVFLAGVWTSSSPWVDPASESLQSSGGARLFVGSSLRWCPGRFLSHTCTLAVEQRKKVVNTGSSFDGHKTLGSKHIIRVKIRGSSPAPLCWRNGSCSRRWAQFRWRCPWGQRDRFCTPRSLTWEKSDGWVGEN